MDKHITYIFPSRSRPDKFFEALSNITAYSTSDAYNIIAVLDSDDTTMQMSSDEFWKKFSAYQKAKAYWGVSESKIHACNRELRMIEPEAEIIALMSDDFKMLKVGFDNDIREAYADGFKGCLHFSDGRIENEPQKKHAVNFQIWILKNGLTAQPNGTWSNGRWKYDNLALMYDAYFLESKQILITFPIMHREYLNIDGFVYHPRFKSVCCDNLFTELAKQRGQYRYIDKKIMQHEHWRNGFGTPDELMQHNESEEFYKHDREVLKELREEFGL